MTLGSGHVVMAIRVPVAPRQPAQASLGKCDRWIRPSGWRRLTLSCMTFLDARAAEAGAAGELVLDGAAQGGVQAPPRTGSSTTRSGTSASPGVNPVTLLDRYERPNHRG